MGLLCQKKKEDGRARGREGESERALHEDEEER